MLSLSKMQQYLTNYNIVATFYKITDLLKVWLFSDGRFSAAHSLMDDRLDECLVGNPLPESLRFHASKVTLCDAN